MVDNVHTWRECACLGGGGGVGEWQVTETRCANVDRKKHALDAGGGG